ncbi:hypothetical protein [Blattabacterium punctulatus]|uniref:hypothetical protein n=1 Tax=Blattabacterium punctulatus TaxID=164514 RepID=UPI000D7C203B|nr:hypothetical protein DM780_02710 [Blattabacterium punctulatus]
MFYKKYEGYLIKNIPIHKLKNQVFLLKKIIQVMLSGVIDIVVHYLKNLPTKLPE